MSYTQGEIVKKENNESAVNQAEFTRRTTVIAANIKKIKLKAQQIDKYAAQLGTDQDTKQFRNQLLSLQNETKEISQNTSKHLSEVSNLHSTDDYQQKTKFTRLKSEFEEALNLLKAAQSKAAKKEGECVGRARAASEARENDSPELRMQGHYQETALMPMNMQEIKEREEMLQKLENSIVDVNQIFTDLASMVEDQGSIIDNIELHVEKSAVKVESGNEQLQKAKENQTKSRKKKFICAGIVAAVLVVIVIVIAVSVPKG